MLDQNDAGSLLAVEQAICGLHPYEVPEILALPVVEGHLDVSAMAEAIGFGRTVRHWGGLQLGRGGTHRRLTRLAAHSQKCERQGASRRWSASGQTLQISA